ncbi:hypothetical protein [Halobaculum sp. EA56]|uniref:hypothetical protein n=1 Tax=Halobaculum sp. EA56 TaxID=3421648 RepID=UPI003EB85AD4
MQNFDIVDKIATAFGAGLMLLGIVGLGVVEILAGEPYGAAPITNEAGEVVATPAVDPALRTGLVILGLVVLFAWGLYRAATPNGEADRTATGATAD